MAAWNAEASDREEWFPLPTRWEEPASTQEPRGLKLKAGRINCPWPFLPFSRGIRVALRHGAAHVATLAPVSPSPGWLASRRMLES